MKTICLYLKNRIFYKFFQVNVNVFSWIFIYKNYTFKQKFRQIGILVFALQKNSLFANVPLSVLALATRATTARKQ